MNSLFSELFKKFGRVLLEVFETFLGPYSRGLLEVLEKVFRRFRS